MTHRFLFSLLTVLFLTTTHAYSAVAPAIGRAGAEKTEMTKKERKRQERMERRQERLEKRMERLQAKIDKKAGKQEAQGIWDDSRFRLGTILLVGAIALGLLGALINVGFFGVLAGLVGLAGLVLMIWSLIEYTA